MNTKQCYYTPHPQSKIASDHIKRALAKAAERKCVNMKTEFKIGDKVLVKTKRSIYYNEWGIVKYFDGDYYHVGIANDNKCAIIFSGNELKLI